MILTINAKFVNFCRDHFRRDWKKTEKLHFGGGNTDWEERKLGKFKTSETRFVEIMDYVCKKDSLTDTIGYSGIKDFQFKCHSLVESHEEVLESWFFDHQDDGPSLEAFLCIEKLKFCCEDGYFGDNCSPCPGMKQSGKPCFGNGRCQGNGSRAGNGTCSCDAGFVGKMCSNCDSAYFAVLQNSTHIECDECFAGCSGGCVGASPKDCRACRIGYKMDPEIGCNDIDECVEAEKCPNAAEKCVNTPGSFECQCIDGFKRSDSGECVVDVVAHPNVPWLQPAEKLRLISYSSLFLITVFVFTVHRSTSTVFLTVSTIFAALLIDYFFGNGILHLFSKR
ncbi:hypothetical protein GPALN_001958 [Globodera pallida]|nr:hypothetical protein GPALN_001958 [Globodera pallida]